MVPGATILLFFAGSTPEPSYALALWQALLYRHRCDLWELTETQAADGDTSPAVYVRRWRNVPCYLVRKISVSQTERFGRTEQDNEFTRDTWWFHESQQVGDSWCIVLKAVDLGGTNHPNYGACWVAAGDRRVQIDTILMEGHVEIESVAQPALPNGVS